MAGERTYFKQISLFRARCIYVARKTSAARPGCCMYIPPAHGEDSRLFFPRGGVSNLKGLKRFPRRVARRIVGPRTPIDRRLLRSRPPTHIPFRLFSLPVSTVTYCELLREPCHPARKRLSLSARKISGNVKDGADGRHACSQYVSSWHVLLESRRLSCVIITFTTRTGCRETAGDIAGRVAGKPHRDERGLGRAFHKTPRVICFKRERYVVSGIQCFETFDGLYECRAVVLSACLYIRNSVADSIACTRYRNVA